MIALLTPLPAAPQGLIANRTLPTRRLGLARAAFFRAVLSAGERHESAAYPSYAGDAPSTLTQWRAVNGRPCRLFQITFIQGPREFPYGGTMATVLGRVKAKVPPRYAKPLKALLAARRDYAAYIDSAGAGVFYCSVVRADGSDWPDPKLGFDKFPQQDDRRIDRDGFAITDEELRLLSRSKTDRSAGATGAGRPVPVTRALGASGHGLWPHEASVCTRGTVFRPASPTP